MLDLYTYEKTLKRVKPDIALLRRLSRQKVRFWLDMISPTPTELAMVKEGLGFHSLVIEDFQAPGTRPKLDDLPNGIFVVLYAIQETPKIRLHELDYFLSNRFLVTSHHHIQDSYELLKHDTKRLGDLFRKGPDFIMHALVDAEIDRYFPILQHYDDQLDHLQDDVLNHPDPKLLHRLFHIKRSILEIRKFAFPQREVIAFLARRESKYISAPAELYFRDINDHMFRLTYMLDSFRDIISTTLEVHLSVVSNKMNEVMKVLTIIATIMMPLTLITGIYGMNFQFMPELGWRYGYFISLGVMLAIGLGFIVYFKKKKWI